MMFTVNSHNFLRLSRGADRDYIGTGVAPIILVCMLGLVFIGELLIFG